jgi:hypothetical protein
MKGIKSGVALSALLLSAPAWSAEWTAMNVNGIAAVENHLLVRAGSDAAAAPDTAATQGDASSALGYTPTTMAPSETDGLGAHDTPAIKPSPTGTSTYGAGPNDRTTVVPAAPRSNSSTPGSSRSSSIDAAVGGVNNQGDLP